MIDRRAVRILRLELTVLNELNEAPVLLLGAHAKAEILNHLVLDEILGIGAIMNHREPPSEETWAHIVELALDVLWHTWIRRVNDLVTGILELVGVEIELCVLLVAISVHLLEARDPVMKILEMCVLSLETRNLLESTVERGGWSRLDFVKRLELRDRHVGGSVELVFE